MNFLIGICVIVLVAVIPVALFLDWVYDSPDYETEREFYDWFLSLGPNDDDLEV